MIKTGFIKKQVKKARQAGKCTRFLSEFALFTVDRALRQHYGDNYSIRCLQASLAVQMILKRFGIGSTLWGEHACVAEAFENPPHHGWGGFWNEEHHMWLYTEFREIVDLTISQLHLHPMVTRRDMIPMPAIWWQEIERWPNTIFYMPTARITPGLQGREKADLDEFMRLVPDILDQTLAEEEVSSIAFQPVLYGEDSMNQLTQAEHPWLKMTLPVHTEGIPMPPWVEQKKRELMERAMGRRPR